MFNRRRPFVRKSASGTARIQRDSYSNDAQGWWTIRDAVWTRDGGLCQSRRGGVVCGKPGKEVHHIIRLSDGGTTTMGNLITLCHGCHDARHTHLARQPERQNAKPKNPYGRKPKLKPYTP